MDRMEQFYPLNTARSVSPVADYKPSSESVLSSNSSVPSNYSSSYSTGSNSSSSSTRTNSNKSTSSTATSSSHASAVNVDKEATYCPSPVVNSSTDITQRDDYDVFACNIVTQMIENLRMKRVRDQDARVVMIRRAETISDVFPDWVKRAFKSPGEYMPYDLNMPPSIRRRERMEDFTLDPPLSNIGAHLSRQMGLSMVQEVPTVIYTSPQLSNIQTGRKLLEGMTVGVVWNIEPGLAGFFPEGTDCPKFDVKLKKDTVLKVSYINSILGKETLEDFHRRIAFVTSKLDFPLGESTMIVAEGCVIDAIIQAFLRNGKTLTQNQAATLDTRIPNLSMMHFDVKDNGKWRMSAASLPGLVCNRDSIRNIPDVNFLCRPIFDY